MTFPVATHNYELRMWLASGGIDPDVDLALMIVPPPQMVDHLSAGIIQGYYGVMGAGPDGSFAGAAGCSRAMGGMGQRWSSR